MEQSRRTNMKYFSRSNNSGVELSVPEGGARTRRLRLSVQPANTKERKKEPTTQVLAVSWGNKSSGEQA